MTARTRVRAAAANLAAPALVCGVVVGVAATGASANDGGAGGGQTRIQRASEAVAVDPARLVIGRSAQGRLIVAHGFGRTDSSRVGLVVGQIHGDEREGLRVARALRRRHRAAGARIWVIESVNPDGRHDHTRRNARGVDLNRNFAHRWTMTDPPSSGYYAGPRPFSEPESRAVSRFIARIRPDVSVWYHQPWGVVLACRGRPVAAARYARLAGMRGSCRGRGLRGTAIGWEKAKLGDNQHFVVELPAQKLNPTALHRQVRAAELVLAVGASAGPRHARAAGADRGLAKLRPPIKRRRIPFGKQRKRDMASYSNRHYGQHTWKLKRPRLIVEHYAEAGSVRSIWNTFAPNRPDVEYGELPGVCSHFAISAKGLIYKLVPVSIRCRHVVGLNHVAIGIEHVGFSDAEVLGRKRERKASLLLTQWLRCRFGIPVKQVIGHAESLGSRFYKERDPDFQGRTHSDFSKSSMQTYRRKLALRGGCTG